MKGLASGPPGSSPPGRCLTKHSRSADRPPAPAEAPRPPRVDPGDLAHPLAVATEPRHRERPPRPGRTPPRGQRSGAGIEGGVVCAAPVRPQNVDLASIARSCAMVGYFEPIVSREARACGGSWPRVVLRLPCPRLRRSTRPSSARTAAIAQCVDLATDTDRTLSLFPHRLCGRRRKPAARRPRHLPRRQRPAARAEQPLPPLPRRRARGRPPLPCARRADRGAGSARLARWGARRGPVPPRARAHRRCPRARSPRPSRRPGPISRPAVRSDRARGGGSSATRSVPTGR